MLNLKNTIKNGKQRLRDYNELIELADHIHAGQDKFDAVAPTMDYADAAINCGYKAMTATGHGNFVAIPSLLDCEDLKIIYGIEGYCKPLNLEISERRAHIVLLAKDEIGKVALVKANSNAESYMDNPILQLEKLKEFKGHIVCQTACTSGLPALELLHNQVINRQIEKLEKSKAEDTAQRMEELKNRLYDDLTLRANAKKAIEYLVDIFGAEDTYVEVQNHGLADEAIVYPILVELAKELGLKLVATNDAHVPTNDERYFKQRKVAQYMRFKSINEDDEIQEAAEREMYIKTPNEIADALLKIISCEAVDEAMMSLNEINEKCTYVPVNVDHYPVFNKKLDSKELLRQFAYEGIEWRFPDKTKWTKEYEERLEYELSVIISMGYADYFLIVKDFLEYGRVCGKVPYDKLSEVPLSLEGAKQYIKDHNYNTGFAIGIGRGSGAGSLVCYLLGITGLDPIPYGLMFER